MGTKLSLWLIFLIPCYLTGRNSLLSLAYGRSRLISQFWKLPDYTTAKSKKILQFFYITFLLTFRFWGGTNNVSFLSEILQLRGKHRVTSGLTKHQCLHVYKYISPGVYTPTRIWDEQGGGGACKLGQR